MQLNASAAGSILRTVHAMHSRVVIVSSLFSAMVGLFYDRVWVDRYILMADVAGPTYSGIGTDQLRRSRVTSTFIHTISSISTLRDALSKETQADRCGGGGDGDSASSLA